MQVIVKDNEAAVIEELAQLVRRTATEAVAKRGAYKIGVSGGSLVKFLCTTLKQLLSDGDGVAISAWRIFFCDERVVPVSDAESTFGLYKNALIGVIDGLKEEQFVQMQQGVSAEVAAVDYIKQMKAIFPGESTPRFDLLLLGMGPDGHTCSLFPGHKLLDVDDVWVAPIVDSPKPPPARITLTFPVINHAAHVAFCIVGASKAEMVKRVLVDKEDLPVCWVKPSDGELIWILDEAARGVV